jgi:hypothetical protein
MSKRLLLVLVAPLLVLLTAPADTLADASVVQDSCIVVGTPPNANLWTYFTVVNFSLPDVVCDLHFIPEPQPVLPGCEMLDTRNAAGWASFLNPFGGADFFANTLNDCIQPGTAKGGFAFFLDPDFCCYVVQFTGPDGSVLLEQEECFTCQKVPTEHETWGKIKSLYR